MTLNQAFEVLKKSADIHDAKIVLRHICGDSKRLSWIARRRLRRAAKNLSKGMPVAKIIGRKWFYGMEFFTNINTLDPRPDSEALVEYVLENFKEREGGLRILDMGCGTGCLICSIIKNLSNATGVGFDISRGACRVAARNVKNLNLEKKVKIIKSDFANFSNEPFDVIISNPPYIAIDDTRVNDGALHDPKISLYAGLDGLDAFHVISSAAGKLLNPGGVIVLEIGAGQGSAVRQIFKNNHWKFVDSKNDLSGIERVLVFCYRRKI